MRRFLRHRRYVTGILMIIAVWRLNSARADVPMPVERFHVRVSEIQDTVLQDAVGVFDLIVPGALQELSRPFTPPRNPAFVGWGHQFFSPLIADIPVYTPTGNSFTMGGTLPLADVIPVSAIMDFDYSSSGPQILRVPLTAGSGAYREIVYDPVRDRRVWLKWSDHGGAATFEKGYFPDKTETLVYGELLFTEQFSRPGPAEWTDIFARSTKNTRALYQAPDETAPVDILSPTSPPLQAYRNRSGNAHDGLFLQQIQNGFGEVRLEGYADVPPQTLGWIKLKEEGYQRFSDYVVTPSRVDISQCIDIFVLSDLTKSRILYQLPQEDAPTSVIRRNTMPGESATGELFITEIKNGFVLLCEMAEYYDDFEKANANDYFCENGGCGQSCWIFRPLGWLKIRDAEHRLTIWPTVPFSFYMGC